MQKTRKITTRLKKRDEVFRLLALGEATGLPVLLLGTHGVAKTQAVLDYIGDEPAYMIQTSMGTRPNDIRGTVDMDHFISHKKYRTISPIADAAAVVIDEVDKTNDSVRDMLLSIMREKKLFLGSEGMKQCQWKLFVGSCNKPPIVSPFWDRFVLRMTVERLPNEDIHQLFDTASSTLSINMPNGELQTIEKQYVDGAQIIADAAYKVLSDRTISYLPKLVKATGIIWELGTEDAIMRLTNIMAPEFIQAVGKKLGVGDESEFNAKVKDFEKVLANPDTMKNYRFKTSERQSYSVIDMVGMYMNAIASDPHMGGTGLLTSKSVEVGIYVTAVKAAAKYYADSNTVPTFIAELNGIIKKVQDITNNSTRLSEKWLQYAAKVESLPAVQVLIDFQNEMGMVSPTTLGAINSAFPDYVEFMKNMVDGATYQRRCAGVSTTTVGAATASSATNQTP